MIAKEILIGGLFILAFGEVLVFALDSINSSPKETPEYQAGYQAGYTESNESKYQASCDLLSNAIFTQLTTEQHNYALGYEHGYRQKQDDLLWSEEQNNTNNSLKILGI